MDENKTNINLLEEIFNSLDTIQGEEGDNAKKGIELFSAILALPEGQFEAVKNILLDSFEKTFNTPDAQIAFAQMMNVNGLKAEDLNNSFAEITKAVDELKEEELSTNKKDFIKSVFSIFINSLNASEGVAKRVIQIPVELCRENAVLPTYATTGSGAMDIYSPADYTIKPGETIIVKTGLKVNIPKGYAILIQPRSGLSVKTHLRVANTPGLIDSDYHEEIGVILENNSAGVTEASMNEEGYCINPLFGSTYYITKGERIAQMRLIEVPMISWLEVKSIGSFDNNHGAGFGSTGKF